MKFSRRTGLKMLAALSALGVTGVSGFAGTDARKPSDETIGDAYVYLLGRVLVLRQEQIDRGGDGFTYNQIKIQSAWLRRLRQSQLRRCLS